MIKRVVLIIVSFCISLMTLAIVDLTISLNAAPGITESPVLVDCSDLYCAVEPDDGKIKTLNITWIKRP